MAHDSSIAAYSDDGITWTETSMPFASAWSSVTYGAGRFVAVGSSSTSQIYGAAYSDDGGETWLPSDLSWPTSAGSANPGTFWGPIVWNKEILKIEFNSPEQPRFYVLSKNSSYGAWSRDGIKWTYMSIPKANWVSIAQLDESNGGMVAAADDAGSFTSMVNSKRLGGSPGGTQWQLVGDPGNWFNVPLKGMTRIRSNYCIGISRSSSTPVYRGSSYDGFWKTNLNEHVNQPPSGNWSSIVSNMAQDTVKTIAIASQPSQQYSAYVTEWISPTTGEEATNWKEISLPANNWTAITYGRTYGSPQIQGRNKYIAIARNSNTAAYLIDYDSTPTLLTPPPTPTPTPWGSWSNAGTQIDGLPGEKISSVSLNGYNNIMAIGSITNSGTSDTGISNTGRVRVYGWTGTFWTSLSTKS